MKKRAMALMAVILMLCLAGCGNPPEEPPHPSDLQAACEQAVLNFTDGEPVEFARKVDSSDQKWPEEVWGFYLFEDDAYQYIVDPDELYIRWITKKTGVKEADGPQCTKENAESMALDLFNKVMSKFLIQGGKVTAECTSPEDSEGSYVITVQESLNGIPTGNSAGILITKKGALSNGVFQKGDAENIKKITNGKDEMISVETAEQTALEEANSMAAELEAENIRIDDSKPCEMMTLGDTTVWAVQFKYSKRGDDSYVGVVMVDAFSGEVFKVYLGA